MQGRFQRSRRRWLAQASGLVACAALPHRALRAQSSAGVVGLLPRQALVIGNARYREEPLKNPVNDARAIGQALSAMGFAVHTVLDAGRGQMLDSIGAFAETLARSKAVGLFYYAGHGAQLAWRNYLLPVEATVDTLEDMRTRTVELNSVLEGLRRAGNAMNVVILDACRDNPFGKRVPVEHKGLSQFDAPPGSLLAYATAPGNVAADGEGEHGVYTEQLLREMRVPQAKIEDVFKRVRLQVRRRTQGRQIPWESTSLEEDFYFVPPQALRPPSEVERAKQFDEELALWEKIQGADTPEPLEDYLRRYPSGRFSELAQFRLDRVLARLGERKVEAVSAPENPYSKGSARLNTDFKIGDSHTYREIDLYTKIEVSTYTHRVTAITEDTVVFNKGLLITDLFGNQLSLPNGVRFTGAQFFIAEYHAGKKWTTRFKRYFPGGAEIDTEFDLKVVTREAVTVPAGRFDAWRIEGQGWSRSPRTPGSLNMQTAYWIAPQVRRPIIVDRLTRHSSGKVTESSRRELVSYTQG
jgi:uncharacterized caspase-like protein